jgi:hypothetical protein
MQRMERRSKARTAYSLINVVAPAPVGAQGLPVYVYFSSVAHFILLKAILAADISAQRAFVSNAASDPPISSLTRSSTIPNFHSLCIRCRFRCTLGDMSYLSVKRVEEQPLLRTRKCERVSHIFQAFDNGVRFLVEVYLIRRCIMSSSDAGSPSGPPKPLNVRMVKTIPIDTCRMDEQWSSTEHLKTNFFHPCVLLPCRRR